MGNFDMPSFTFDTAPFPAIRVSMEENRRFIKVRRANGELVFFNIQHISMVFADPVDRSVLLVGTGFEKRFRSEEALHVLQIVDGMAFADTGTGH